MRGCEAVFTGGTFHLTTNGALQFFKIYIPLLIMLSLVVTILLTKRGEFARVLGDFFLLPVTVPMTSIMLL